MRNTVGFDWHPDTKEMYFTDNGRDGESAVLPVRAGLRFPRPLPPSRKHSQRVCQWAQFAPDASPCKSCSPRSLHSCPPPSTPTHPSTQPATDPPTPPFCSLHPVDMGGQDTAFTDNHPDCELNHAPTKGLHFGYPYCHTGPAGDQVDALPYLRLPGVGTNEVDPQLNIGERPLVCNGEIKGQPEGSSALLKSGFLPSGM